MNSKRVRLLNQDGLGRAPVKARGPVVYWMKRDQRSRDNWALIYAQEMSIQARVPLVVVFCLVPEFLGATWRQYSFMISGLKEVESSLRNLSIPFFVLEGDPAREIPQFVQDMEACMLVTDFDPLRINRSWVSSIIGGTENGYGISSGVVLSGSGAVSGVGSGIGSSNVSDLCSVNGSDVVSGTGCSSRRIIDIPFYEVDAHNIVPCWEASSKQEYAARTFRPKIWRAVPEFLDDFPEPRIHPFPLKGDEIDWARIERNVMNAVPSEASSVPPVSWIKPGETAARQRLESFIVSGLDGYADCRNDPSHDCQSGLSPYLHFGHLSPQRAALEILAAPDWPSKGAFLEELIVRRELSDNLCFYNQAYDSYMVFPSWAQASLNAHRDDRREYVYTPAELARGDTHDEIWNSCQLEMVHRGKMHGYLRMYWAKKILEWSQSPEKALAEAIRQNDRYELDGRDPNGYVGAAWCIGGLHDRAFSERPVYGKVRYMSHRGLRSKFDMDSYIQRIQSISSGRSFD